MKLTDLIAEIRQFMGSTDHSNSPRLRQFLEEYSALCAELNGDLEKCGESIRHGNVREARRLNLSFDPPLTRRVQLLNFPERKDFLDLCASYGYPMPPPFDAEILQQLNSPADNSERKLAELMQQWRQLARSGTTEEKMHILRAILELMPKGSSAEWNKNLAALERQRDAEIAGELTKQDWALPELEHLQKLYMELRRPDRLTLAPKTTLQRIEELLKPLQKQSAADKAERLSEQMQMLYAERNLPELRKAVEEWNTLKCHPLVNLTPEQIQTEQDVLRFLEEMDQEEERRKQFDELLFRINHGFAANDAYRDQEQRYNQLVLLGFPLPKNLAERMSLLQVENESHERGKNIRRCVYSGVGALLLLILLGAVLIFTMHFRRVDQICASYEKLLKQGDFNAVLENYAVLAGKEPRTAGDAKVKKQFLKAQSAANQWKQEVARAHETFRRNLNGILELLKNGLCEDPRIEQFGKELELLKRYLSKEELDQFSRLKTRVSKERRDALERHKADFETEAGKIFAELEKIKRNVPSAPDLCVLSAELGQQKSRYRQLLAVTRKPVLEQLGEKIRLEWDTRTGDLEQRLKQEADFRDIRSRLEQPSDIPGFLKALGEARERQPELARIYAKAAIPAQEFFMERMNRISFFLDSSRTAPLLSGTLALPDDLRDTPQGNDIRYCAFQPGSFDPKMFLEEILRNLNLHELLFKDPDGRIIVFYTDTRPKIIRPPGNPELIRGIQLEVRPGSGRKNVSVRLKMTGRKPVTFQIQVAGKHLPELEKIGPLTLVSGLDLQSGECQKNAAYISAVQFQAEKVAPQNQEEYVRRLFRTTASDAIRNPRLRAFLLSRLLTGLGKTAPVYADVSAPFRDSLEALRKTNQRDALHPLAFDGTEDLQELLKNFPAEKLLAEKDRISRFYYEMLSKGFYPAGIINSTLKPYFFSARPKELLTVSPDSVHLLQTDFSTGKIHSEDQKHIWPGQVVWGFPDNCPVRKFFSPDGEALKGTKLAHRPSMWPQNLYFRND